MKKARRIFLLENRLTLAPSRSENPFSRHALVLINGFEMGSKKFLTRASGFSLLETIIAIAVLTVAMTAVFSLVSSGVRSISLAANQLTAYFLASEGVEYIRNIRDGNVLSGTGNALDGFFVCESYGCVADVYNNTLSSCSAGCPHLNFDTGLGVYNHNPETRTHL